MKENTLSVVMPNYNHAHYIGRAIKAILSQSYKPMEIIIIDDASTDNSVEIIQRFVELYPIIHLMINKRNIGPIPNMNRFLQLASGDNICYASADDQVLPGFFEKSMNLIARYPQAGLCCSDPVFFDSQSGTISENKLLCSENSRYFLPDEFAQVLRGGWIAGHTSIIKRSALFEVGGFIPKLRWHCDWFALLVIGFRYGICYIPEPLATILVYPDSVSVRGRRDWSQQSQVLKHLLHILKSPAYRDVLPYFIRSASMAHFNGEIVRVVISNPQHWDFQSLLLIKKPLWNEVRRILSSIIPAVAKRLYRRIRYGWCF